MAAAPVTQKSASVEPEGARLANRIVGFARMLRRAGLRIGPAAVMDAAAMGGSDGGHHCCIRVADTNVACTDDSAHSSKRVNSYPPEWIVIHAS